MDNASADNIVVKVTESGVKEKSMNISFRLIFALLFFSLLVSISYGEDRIWQFDDARDVKGWTASNAHITRTSPGILSVRGSDPFRIVSPPNLNIPSDLSSLQFRIKAPASDLFGYAIIKTVDNKTWHERYSFEIANRFNVQRINLKQFVKTDAAVDSLVLAFGGIDRIELDYVKFSRPSVFESIRYHWHQFWKIAPLRGTTINTIDTPIVAGKPFLMSLYIFLPILALFLLGMFKLLRKYSIMKVLFISFVVTGMLFVIRMEYQWHMQWPTLQTVKSRNNIEEKLIFFGNFDLYSLARELKEIIPSDEKVRIYSESDANKIALRYYLLPLIFSDSGDYMVVFADSGASFDSVRKKLIIGDRAIAENVSLLRIFEKGTVLYKTQRFNKR